MYGRIVELYALTDSYGTGAYDYDSLLLVLSAYLNIGNGFVVSLIVIRRVEVRRLGRELSTAGIDHLESCVNVAGKLVARKLFELLVGIAIPLALHVFRPGDCSACNLRLIVGKILELVEEPLVNLGY